MDNYFVTAGNTVSTSTHQTRISSDSGLTGTIVRPPVHCPECKKQFGHRQDAKRHILSMHLPCWIFCPYPSCNWRGTRTYALKSHLDRNKCGPSPEFEDQCQIYDTNLILGWILQDDIPVQVAASYALDFVGERARELGKLETWRDLWGR